MTSRRRQLMATLPILSLGAIGLLVARERSGADEYLYGAYGLLVTLFLVGSLTAVAGRERDEQVDPRGPSTDDIERVLTHNVAAPVTAKSVIEQHLPPAPEPEPVPVMEPPVVPTAMPTQPEPVVAPMVLSPSSEAFVNIGRRNKQLNRQMLTLIAHLEKDELDPEVLHGLYELDHLATRMRRNEETLLLLASTRRVRQWSPPVALENVLRSALAEVERFSRVEIDQVPDVEVMGEAVSDMAHLLAELIDNATEFSHASTVVTVSAHTTLEGIEIEVLDAGHGMDQSKLDALNELLADPPSVEQAPSRRLGLFIAARIADGMPISVVLTGQRGVGTVATVSVDSALIVEAEEPDDDSSLDEALDLLDPVMQLAVGAELAQDEEDELAIAALPTDEDVAGVLGSMAIDEADLTNPTFPTVVPDTVVSDTVVSDTAPLPSRIPQATFESIWGNESLVPMPEASVVSHPTAGREVGGDFDDETARDVAIDAGSAISAFTVGVARGLAEADGSGAHGPDWSEET